MTHLAPEAVRAGRAILKWSTRDLAAEAGLNFMTVNAVENGRSFKDETRDAILAAFARHGVEILNSGSPGARLKR